MSGNTLILNNRYHIQSKLGQGGMGVVYRAHDRLNNQTVALKQVLVPMSDLDFASRVDTESDWSLALAQEFRTVASLRHPNIISVLDYGFTEQTKQPYFTMEYLAEVQGFHDIAPDMSQEQRIERVIQLLQAIAYLHRRKIIHRDLKPDNVVVVDGQVKTLDFGLAILRQDKPSSENHVDVAGTLAYLAPELFSEALPHPGSDLWAVGIMMYQLLAGRHPFNISNPALLIQSVLMKDAGVQALNLPPDLTDVLERLLVKDPDERYENAFDVIDDLYRAIDKAQPDENKDYRESFIQAAKFTGRDKELEHLQDALANAQIGQGRGILIGGESGVGKSRLLEELRIQALVQGFTVLRGQAVSSGGQPFQLWRDVMRRLVLSVELEDLDKRVLKEIIPDIGTLLDEDIDDAPRLDSSAHDDRLMLAIVGALRNYGKPILLILEDLHWTSESLKVLKNLLLWVKDLPLLAIGSYRNDEAPELPQQLTDMNAMVLSRLDDAAIAELSESILGVSGVHPQLLDVLKHETEGNCFFVVEVIRALAEESGRLANIGQMTLPAQIFAGGIQEIVQRRLNRLPERVREWLRVVALAGRQLDMSLIGNLSANLGYPGWQSDFLLLCADAAVLEVLDDNWRFSHDKIREALIANIPDNAKSELHRHIAENLETLYPDDESFYEILLDHWHGAGDLDKELTYLSPVAKYLIVIRGSYVAARTLLERGLSALPPNDSRRVQLLNLQVHSHEKQGSYETALKLAGEAHHLAQTHGDNKGIASNLSDRGWINVRLGNFQAATEDAEASLAIYRTMAYQPGIASCLQVLGEIARLQGQHDDALTKYQQALAIYEAGDDARDMALAYMQLGVIQSQAGSDLNGARENLDRGLAIFQEIGDRQSIAGILNSLGVIAESQADYETAKHYFRQVVEIGQSLGDQIGVGVGFANIGYMTIYERQYDVALDYIQQGLTIFETIGFQFFVAMCSGALGFLNVKLGNYTEAIRLFHKTLSLAKDMDAKPLSLETMGYIAVYMLAAGNAKRAAELRALVAAHPMGDMNTKKLLDHHFPLSDFDGRLSTHDLQIATEHGKLLDLDNELYKLLDQLASEGAM